MLPTNNTSKANTTWKLFGNLKILWPMQSVSQFLSTTTSPGTVLSLIKYHPSLPPASLVSEDANCQAGIHAKAILANPSTYEILDPADFGQTRYVHIGSRLTGWNAVKSRADQLKLNLSDDQVKAITAKIKKLADIRTLSIVFFLRIQLKLTFLG